MVVLGGSGFIGKNLCDYLMRYGHEVVSVSHQRPGSAACGRCRELTFDLMGEETVDSLLWQIDACDVCVMLSWVGTGARDCLDINLESARRLFDVFRAFAGKFPEAMYIQAGSAAEYGRHDHEVVTEKSVCEPFLPYGKGKLYFYEQASAYSRTHQVNFVELRFHSVFGMETNERKLIIHVISSLVRGMPVALRSECGQMWNFISVNQVCELIGRVIGKGIMVKDAYNVGGNGGKTLRQYFQRLTDVCGVEETMLSFADQPDTASYNFIFDSSRIQEELGWQPVDDFEDVTARIRERFIDG